MYKLPHVQQTLSSLIPSGWTSTPMKSASDNFKNSSSTIASLSWLQKMCFHLIITWQRKSEKLLQLWTISVINCGYVIRFWPAGYSRLIQMDNQKFLFASLFMDLCITVWYHYNTVDIPQSTCNWYGRSPWFQGSGQDCRLLCHEFNWALVQDRSEFNFIVSENTQPGLTHWGRVTHICVSKLTIIGSDNGLSPGRRQAIIWTNAGKLLIRTLGTNFSEIIGEIHSFSFSKMHLKMSSAKWRLFGLGLNELT